MCAEVKKQIDQCIHDNQRSDTDESATEMSMSWKDVMPEQLKAQPKTFYSDGIMKPLDQIH